MHPHKTLTAGCLNGASIAGNFCLRSDKIAPKATGTIIIAASAMFRRIESDTPPIATISNIDPQLRRIAAARRPTTPKPSTKIYMYDTKRSA